MGCFHENHRWRWSWTLEGARMKTTRLFSLWTSFLSEGLLLSIIFLYPQRPIFFLYSRDVRLELCHSFWTCISFIQETTLDWIRISQFHFQISKRNRISNCDMGTGSCCISMVCGGRMYWGVVKGTSGSFADTIKQSTVTILSLALSFVQQSVFISQTLLSFLPQNILSIWTQCILIKHLPRISIKRKVLN